MDWKRIYNLIKNLQMNENIFLKKETKKIFKFNKKLIVSVK